MEFWGCTSCVTVSDLGLELLMERADSRSTAEGFTQVHEVSYCMDARSMHGSGAIWAAAACGIRGTDRLKFGSSRTI